MGGSVSAVSPHKKSCDLAHSLGGLERLDELRTRTGPGPVQWP